jgi:hypothetical protein
MPTFGAIGELVGTHGSRDWDLKFSTVQATGARSLRHRRLSESLTLRGQHLYV